MAGCAVGWFGLLAFCVRIALLQITGPVNPRWLHDAFHFDWWALQPALWATAVQQTRQLSKKTGELQAENVHLTTENEALQHRLRLTGFTLGMAVAAATTSGIPGVLRGRLPSRQFWRLSTNSPVLKTTASSSVVGHSGDIATIAALAAIAGVAMFDGICRARPRLRHHVSKEVTERCVRRTVTIECPGVLRSGITIRVPPQINGAEVEIRRSGAVGITAAVWSRRFKFPWEEGVFECRQEEMQLENGVLRLVFVSELKRDRLVHLPPPWSPQVFALAGGDIPSTQPPSSSASHSQPEDECSPTAPADLAGQLANTLLCAAKLDQEDKEEEEEEE